MTEFRSTQERVAFYLKQMEKAMPEIKGQIKVYEEAVKAGSRRKSKHMAPQRWLHFGSQFPQFEHNKRESKPFVVSGFSAF